MRVRIGRVLVSTALTWIACGVLALPALAQQRASPLKMSYQNLSAAHDSARAKKSWNGALPGDTLRYSITFLNSQPRALLKVVFNNAIPKGLRLVGGSVTTTAPAKVEYSTDGGVTYAEQPMVSVVQDGQRVQRPAPPESYTSIRWTVAGSVAPGGSVSARYDVRVGTP